MYLLKSITKGIYLIYYLHPSTVKISIVKPVNVSTDDAEAGICDVVIGWTDPVVDGLESEVCRVVGAVMGGVTESIETASVGTENEEQ